MFFLRISPGNAAHTRAAPSPLLALLDGEEELELGRELLLGVQAIREVDAADAAVRVDLHAERFNVVRSWGAPKEWGADRCGGARSERRARRPTEDHKTKSQLPAVGAGGVFRSYGDDDESSPDGDGSDGTTHLEPLKYPLRERGLTVGAAGEVGQVELDLVPALIQSHGHRANEWFDARC